MNEQTSWPPSPRRVAKKSQIKTVLAEIDRLGAWYLAHKPEAKRRVGNIISKSIDLGITPEQRERAIQEMVR